MLQRNISLLIYEVLAVFSIGELNEKQESFNLMIFCCGLSTGNEKTIENVVFTSRPVLILNRTVKLG